MLYEQSAGRFTRNLFEESIKKYDKIEIERQLAEQKGPVFEAIRVQTRSSSSKTENVEAMTSLQLSDFYFPHDETKICFEIRRSIDPSTIKTYEELIRAFESSTYIDCQVSTASKSLKFQIKRYPFERLGETNDSFIKWFDEVIGGYAPMNGTILAIIIQPTGKLVQSPFNPFELSKYVDSIKERISFDEIALIYNDKSEYFVLHKLYPEQSRLLIPLEHGLKRFRGEI